MKSLWLQSQTQISTGWVSIDEQIVHSASIADVFRDYIYIYIYDDNKGLNSIWHGSKFIQSISTLLYWIAFRKNWLYSYSLPFVDIVVAQVVENYLHGGKWAIDPVMSVAWLLIIGQCYASAHQQPRYYHRYSIIFAFQHSKLVLFFTCGINTWYIYTFIQQTVDYTVLNVASRDAIFTSHHLSPMMYCAIDCGDIGRT